jgi:hypothetical protein
VAAPREVACVSAAIAARRAAPVWVITAAVVTCALSVASLRAAAPKPRSTDVVRVSK